jgi:hypothetical protein
LTVWPPFKEGFHESEQQPTEAEATTTHQADSVRQAPALFPLWETPGDDRTKDLRRVS